MEKTDTRMGVASAQVPMKFDNKPNLKNGSETGMPVETEGGSTIGVGSMDIKAIEVNVDGLISKKEWMGHQTKMWGQMKTKKGMMPIADMESLSKAAPF